jgi:hypothetical protein
MITDKILACPAATRVDLLHCAQPPTICGKHSRFKVCYLRKLQHAATVSATRTVIRRKGRPQHLTMIVVDTTALPPRGPGSICGLAFN